MKIIPVTCALIVKVGLLLCAQRSETMNLPLKWELPGGKVEAGETEADCLAREIEEELGIEIHILDKLETNLHQMDSERQILLIPFLCVIIGDTIEPREHKEIRWIATTELMQLEWAEADIPIINRFIQNQI